MSLTDIHLPDPISPSDAVTYKDLPSSWEFRVYYFTFSFPVGLLGGVDFGWGFLGSSASVAGTAPPGSSASANYYGGIPYGILLAPY